MVLNKKENENKASDDKSETAKNFEGPNVEGTEKSISLAIFHLIERVLLIIVVLMTVGAVAFEIHTIYSVRSINLADILLMFLYLEVIGMVAVFYSDRRSAFVYPIFIAITALARLIVLQGKDMAPENILYEAIAILILAIAAIILIKWREK
jgi:protein PsiE